MGIGNYYFESDVLDRDTSNQWHKMVYVDEYWLEDENGEVSMPYYSVLVDIQAVFKKYIPNYQDAQSWLQYGHANPSVGDADVIGQVGELFVCASSTGNDHLAIIVTPTRKWHEHLYIAVHNNIEWSGACEDYLQDYGVALSYICSGKLAQEMEQTFTLILEILDKQLSLAEQMSFRSTAWTSDSYSFYKQNLLA